MADIYAILIFQSIQEIMSINLNPIQLIIERGEDGLYWGRTNIDDNLLTENAATVEELEVKIRQLIYDFHGIEPENVVFEVEYDLETFFEEFDFLNISKIAKQAGINSSLMRQYASGTKHPGQKQVKKIEEAIRSLGQRLSEVTFTHYSV